MTSALPWQGHDVVEVRGNSVLSLSGVLKIPDMDLTTFKLTYRLLQLGMCLRLNFSYKAYLILRQNLYYPQKTPYFAFFAD